MKKLITLFLTLVYVLALAACAGQPKTFDVSGADKIIVRSGTNGKYVEITNTNDINYITENINSLEYTKGKKLKSEGWYLQVKWLDEKGEAIEKMVLSRDGHTIVYEGYYYYCTSTDSQIDVNFLESLFVN